jgi:L-asparaginase
LKTIFLIATGGTIEKSYCERTGSVENFSSKIESYLTKIWLPHTRIEVVSLLSKDSRDLTSDDRKSLAEAILPRLALGSPFVITHGTDTILETARYLEANLPDLLVPVVLTGAMRPLGFENSDGIPELGRESVRGEARPAGSASGHARRTVQHLQSEKRSRARHLCRSKFRVMPS